MPLVAVPLHGARAPDFLPQPRVERGDIDRIGRRPGRMGGRFVLLSGHLGAILDGDCYGAGLHMTAGGLL